MAAVLSETITETPHFAKMRRGDERQRSPASSQYSQSSRPRSHVPPSPRPPQPTNPIPQQSPIIAQEPPPNSRGSNIHPNLETRQSFASQQYFAHPILPLSRPGLYLSLRSRASQVSIARLACMRIQHNSRLRNPHGDTDSLGI